MSICRKNVCVCVNVYREGRQRKRDGKYSFILYTNGDEMETVVDRCNMKILF